MRNGETYFINENIHTALKRLLKQNFKERKEFFDIDADTTIKIDQISSITLDKD